MVQSPRVLTSTQPFLHCCDTWRALAAEGTLLPNRPEQEETWQAIKAMQRALLDPIERQFGVVVLTYGFAGRELVKAVRRRAKEGGWVPNIHPPGDQHAGHELNTHGKRICERDGIAVDLYVPGHSSEDVATWVRKELPFDAMYLYAANRPFHLSWAPEPRSLVVQMCSKTGGGLVPKTIVRGKTMRDSRSASPRYYWHEVAHTINGYEVAGSFEACVERARAVERRLAAGEPIAAISTEDLRLALFFAARAERHAGYDREDTSQLEAMVAELRLRHGDEWLDHELARVRSATRS
jgi:hypothetical protein